MSTGFAAAAAMLWVNLRVDTFAAALSLTTWAGDLACSSGAKFTALTLSATGATVVAVCLGIHADIVALC